METVDDYIALAPKEVQDRLKTLRATIMAAAPNAEERISYGRPQYTYKGRPIYLDLGKKHIGLYALAAPVLAQYKTELKGYVTDKGTVRFPLAESLPVALIEKLVKAQVKFNDEADKKK